MCSVKQPKHTRQPVSNAPVECGKSKKEDLVGDPNGDAETLSRVRPRFRSPCQRLCCAERQPARPVLERERRWQRHIARCADDTAGGGSRDRLVAQFRDCYAKPVAPHSFSADHTPHITSHHLYASDNPSFKVSHGIPIDRSSQPISLPSDLTEFGKCLTLPDYSPHDQYFENDR